MTDPADSLNDAIDKLQLGWSRKQCIQVEDLLKQHPGLSQNNHCVLDLIYAEVLAREANGQSVREADFTRRFPELHEEIARQFQLHRALNSVEAELERPTAIGSLTVPENAPFITQPTEGFPQIAGFEILELAGRGGSGVAYRAYDQQLKRTVAIKLLHTLTSQDSVQRQRLVREAEAAASLVHPSIVQVHQIGESKGDPYLVMEFIDGLSLAEMLQDGPLPVNQAVDVVVSVARAISHAHDSGIIHRDLKPANVLMDKNKEPHVCDFGLARQIESEFTLHATGDVMGTPAYMPPEQARGEGVTVVSDVYSLGAVLYQCLTGRPPFLASTPWEIMTQVMTDDPPTVRQLNSSLPRDLDTICSVALQKNSSRRYASAAMFADELQRFRKGEPIQARPVGRIEKFLKLCKRHPAVTTLVTVSLVALTALAIVSTASAERVSKALGETKLALDEAETQRDVAFDAMKSLVYQVHDDLAQRDASVEARGQVLESAIKGLQRLLDTSLSRDDLRLAMSDARTRLGFILSQQGQNDAAEQQHLQSIELVKAINTDEAVLQSARSHSNLAFFYLRNNRPDDAIKMAQATTVLLDRCDEDLFDPGDVKLIEAQAKSNLGAALAIKGQMVEGLAVRQDAFQLNKELHQQSPDSRKIMLQMADSGLQVAYLLKLMGRAGEAESDLKDVIALLKAEAQKSAEDAATATTLYRALHGLADIQLARMQFTEALVNFDLATNGYQSLVAAEPERPGFRLKLGALHRDSGYCLLAINKTEEAIQRTDQSILELQKGMELGGEPYRVQRFSIGEEYTTLADFNVRKGDLPAATEALRKAIEIVLPIVEEYSLQTVVDGIQYEAECLAGMSGQDSKAEEQDVKRLSLAYDVYQAAQEDNFQPLLDSQQQLKSDIETASQSNVKSRLLKFRCQHLGMHFAFLNTSADVSDQQLQVIRSEAIDAVKIYASLPDAPPKSYRKIPELIDLRKTEAFALAFNTL